MLHIYLFSKKNPVTSCLLPQVLVYRQLALASTYLIVPASTRVYGGALDIVYFLFHPLLFSRTCLPLSCATRGEARNYGNLGHHHFRTESSTLKTVINSIFE